MTVYKTSFERRKQRVRRKIKQISNITFRLAVFKSNSNIYAQIIDDKLGITVASASTLDAEVLKALGNKKSTNIQAAAVVGETIGQRALQKGLSAIVFDRSGYQYHGKIKALADAARAVGLKF
jgi:large subunit ribosomal protein L18